MPILGFSLGKIFPLESVKSKTKGNSIPFCGKRMAGLKNICEGSSSVLESLKTYNEMGICLSKAYFLASII